MCHGDPPTFWNTRPSFPKPSARHRSDVGHEREGEELNTEMPGPADTVEVSHDAPPLVLVAARRGPAPLCRERTVQVRTAQLMVCTYLDAEGRLAVDHVDPPVLVEKYDLDAGMVSTAPHRPSIVQEISAGLPLPRFVKTRLKLEPMRLQTISTLADVFGSSAVPVTKQSPALAHATEVGETASFEVGPESVGDDQLRPPLVDSTNASPWYVARQRLLLAHDTEGDPTPWFTYETRCQELPRLLEVKTFWLSSSG